MPPGRLSVLSLVYILSGASTILVPSQGFGLGPVVGELLKDFIAEWIVEHWTSEANSSLREDQCTQQKDDRLQRARPAPPDTQHTEWPRGDAGDTEQEHSPQQWPLFCHHRAAWCLAQILTPADLGSCFGTITSWLYKGFIFLESRSSQPINGNYIYFMGLYED